MSRAFVKEPDGDDAADVLPDRPVRPHPNLVTARGLAAIEAELDRLSGLHLQALEVEDRALLASTDRNLRYWTLRRASAQLVKPGHAPAKVAFGVHITIARGDGRRETFRIVGEDEADPRSGTLAWTAPLVRALMGVAVGDTATFRGEEIEVLHVEP